LMALCSHLPESPDHLHARPAAAQSWASLVSHAFVHLESFLMVAQVLEAAHLHLHPEVFWTSPGRSEHIHASLTAAQAWTSWVGHGLVRLETLLVAPVLAAAHLRSQGLSLGPAGLLAVSAGGQVTLDSATARGGAPNLVPVAVAALRVLQCSVQHPALPAVPATTQAGTTSRSNHAPVQPESFSEKAEVFNMQYQAARPACPATTKAGTHSRSKHAPVQLEHFFKMAYVLEAGHLHPVSFRAPQCCNQFPARNWYTLAWMLWGGHVQIG